MEKKSNQTLRIVILTALFAAMTFALTFSVKFPMPGGGYIHMGDAMIYLSACILPTPFAMLAAAIGGAMSDFVGGYTIYVIPTLIIKALNAAPFSAKSEKILTLRNGLCVVGSGVVTVVGYYITKAAMLAIAATGAQTTFTQAFFKGSTWVAAAANIPENVVQAVGSAVLFFVIAFALDKVKIKDKIKRLMKA